MLIVGFTWAFKHSEDSIENYKCTDPESFFSLNYLYICWPEIYPVFFQTIRFPQDIIMKALSTNLLFIIAIISQFQSNAQTKNLLLSCWNREVKPLGANYLSLTFAEKRSELENTYEPWQAVPYKGNGNICCKTDYFAKKDSILTGHKVHTAKVQYNSNVLLWQDYDARTLSAVSKDMAASYLLQTARFTPVLLIDYFKQKNIEVSKESNQFYSLYKTTINDKLVSLYIRNSDSLNYMTTILENDKLYGDALTTILYDEFQHTAGLEYPGRMKIAKVNGKVNDEVRISAARLMTDPEILLVKPSPYAYADDIVVKPEVSVEKYSDHIHFISLKHTSNKVMVVEFSTFLMVIDAPLSSGNGDIIIREAKKLAPDKPINFFSFGHHHPEYIGGVRAFVHEGSKIITTPSNKEYVKFLVNNPHTISNDMLQKEPHALLLDSIVNNMKRISDGKIEMKIYLLGVKSHHTGDYLIYYFPAEKLLFQDDMIQMKSTGQMIKANARQLGLYEAIKELKLDVKTIVQSYQAGKDFKTIISYEELEKSTK